MRVVARRQYCIVFLFLISLILPLSQSSFNRTLPVVYFVYQRRIHYKGRNAGGFVPSLSGINVIDTVGAGDIFGGSAMWKLLSLGKPPAEVTAEELREVVSFATAAAGLSTTKHGGMTSVPSLEEIAKVKG